MIRFVENKMPDAVLSYAKDKKPLSIQLNKLDPFIKDYAYKYLKDYISNRKLTWGGYNELCAAFPIQPIEFQNSPPYKEYALFFPNKQYLAIDIDVPNKDVDVLPLLELIGITVDNSIIERSPSGGYHIYAENLHKLDKDVNLSSNQSKDDTAFLFGQQEVSKEVFGERIENYSDMEKLFGEGCKWGFEIKTKTIIAYNRFLGKSDKVTVTSSTRSSKGLVDAILDIHEKNKKETDPIRFYHAYEFPVTMDSIRDYLSDKGVWWKNKSGYIQVQCPFHDDSVPSAAFHFWRGIAWFKCFTEDLVLTFLEFVERMEGSESEAKEVISKLAV